MQKKATQAQYWIPVVFAIFVVAWGGNEFTPLLVFYRQEHYFSPVFVDSLLAFYAVGIVLSLWIAGSFSDQWGRKPFIPPALIASFLGSAFIAFGQHSEVFIALGRAISGVAVGIIMSVGSAWVKELSQIPWDDEAGPNTGAQRSSMALTSGFALGALVAGILAQWAPLPGQLSYVLHGIMCVVAWYILRDVPETRQRFSPEERDKPSRILRVDILLNPRFRRILLYSAPWIFSAGALAYAIMPRLIEDKVSSPVALAGLLSVVTLGSAFLAQKFGLGLLGDHSAQGTLISLYLLLVGLIASVWTALSPTLIKALIVAVILGLSYGMGMLAGLAEVQRVAEPNRLSSAMAVFYGLAYLGFFLPAVMTFGTKYMTYQAMLSILVVCALVSLLIVGFFSRKNLPHIS